MITFKPAMLHSGAINHTRWRESPTPRYERDGYTICLYKYDSDKKDWCDPYYCVYHNSSHISHSQRKYPSFDAAVQAANEHAERHGLAGGAA